MAPIKRQPAVKILKAVIANSTRAYLRQYVCVCVCVAVCVICDASLITANRWSHGTEVTKINKEKIAY